MLQTMQEAPAVRDLCSLRCAAGRGDADAINAEGRDDRRRRPINRDQAQRRLAQSHPPQCWAFRCYLLSA